MTLGDGRDERRTARFLLVEDDDAHAMLVELAFRDDAGRSSLTRVRSGEEALDVIRTPATRPDVILLDLKLIGIDGFDVLGQVKAAPETRDIPVVVLTTSAARRDHARAEDLGANSYVVKPVGFDAFCRTVKTIRDYWTDLHFRPVATALSEVRN